MKKQIVSILAVLGFAAVCGTPAFGQDLEALAGKWSCLKTNEDGQRYTQQIEIKKDKFTFKLADKDGDTMIYAEGDVKLDKAGPFKTMILSNIKAGQSAGHPLAGRDWHRPEDRAVQGLRHPRHQGAGDHRHRVEQRLHPHAQQRG